MADSDSPNEDNEIVRSQDISAPTSGDEETITCSNLIPMAQSEGSQITPFGENQLSTFNSSNSQELAIPNPGVSVSIPQGQFPGANFGPRTKNIQKTTNDNRGQTIHITHHHHYPGPFSSPIQPSTSFTPAESKVRGTKKKNRGEWPPRMSQGREKRGESGMRKHGVNRRDQDKAENPDPNRQRRIPGQNDGTEPGEDDPRNRKEAGPAAALMNQAGQASTSSDELVFVSSIKASKSKQLHPDKDIYEGEKKTAVGQIPIAVKLVKKTDRALKEAKSLHAMDSHPNVVKIIDSDIHVAGNLDYVFIAMELCSKETLYKYIVNQQKKDFDPNLAIRHATQLINGLKHIHSKNVIHRDLKPNNILFSRDENHPHEVVKITDFGLSKQTDKFATSQTHPGAGSHGYMAPEVINEEKISAKSDIFSLGLLLFFRLSNGKHPYGQRHVLQDANIALGKEPNLDGLLIEDEEIRIKVEIILRRMLQHDPEQRPTASEILEEWSQIKFQKGSVQTVEQPEHQELNQANASAKSLGAFVQTAGQPKHHDLHEANASAEPEEVGSNEEKDAEYQKKADDDKDEESVPTPCILMLHGDKMSALTGCTEKEYQLQDVADLPTSISSPIWYTAVLVGRNVYVLTEHQYVFKLNLDDLVSGWHRVQSTIYQHKLFPPAGVLNDNIYVCGGRQWVGGKWSFTNTCEAYTKQTEWVKISDMKQPRAYNCVVSLDGYIYGIGGLDKDGKPLKSVERYDPGTDKWKMIKPMKEARWGAASTVFKGKIYVLAEWLIQERIRTAADRLTFSGKAV